MSIFPYFLYILTHTHQPAIPEGHGRIGNNADTAILQSILSPAYYVASQPSPFSVAAKTSLSNHCCTS